MTLEFWLPRASGAVWKGEIQLREAGGAISNRPIGSRELGDRFETPSWLPGAGEVGSPTDTTFGPTGLTVETIALARDDIRRDGQHAFNMTSGNGEKILASERYTSRSSAEDGIASVRVNAPLDQRYGLSATSLTPSSPFASPSRSYRSLAPSLPCLPAAPSSFALIEHPFHAHCLIESTAVVSRFLAQESGSLCALPRQRNSGSVRATMRSEIKAFIDRHLPDIAAGYRQCRDLYVWTHQKPRDTGLGFQLYGEQDQSQSRTASNEIRRFGELLRGAEAFVDVGANVGLFTCLAARQGYPVVAIEPHPLNVQLLLKNLELNSLAGVQVLPLGLSRETAVGRLRGGGQGATLTPGYAGIRSNYATLIPTQRLDDVLHGRFLGKRLLIKVDVEGHEFAVLEGALQTLARSPRAAWLMEIGFTENFAGSVNPDFHRIFERFWSHDFTCCNVLTGRRVEFNDVEAWLKRGERGFGDLNYVFE